MTITRWLHDKAQERVEATPNQVQQVAQGSH